jgi:methionyl-tRNA formyltransferase
MRKLRAVGLVAREAGLATLTRSLLVHPGLEVVCIAAHRRLPRSEDPQRGERPEWAAMTSACASADVELVAADSLALAKDLDFLDGRGPIDIVCAVSWRYLLTPKALARPRLGAINLHRGALPEFAGAEPVRRAIEAGRIDAVITAHLMVEEVDAGPVLGSVHLPMSRDGSVAPTEHAEVVKQRLVPLYPALLDLAIAALRARTNA